MLSLLISRPYFCIAASRKNNWLLGYQILVFHVFGNLFKQQNLIDNGSHILIELIGINLFDCDFCCAQVMHSLLTK